MATVNDQSNPGRPRNDRLMQLIADCMERQDRGENVDRLALLRENPDLAQDLLRYFNDEDALFDVVGRPAPAKPSNPAAHESVSLKSRDQSTDHEHSMPGAAGIEETRVLPQKIGRYQVLFPLGRGGMGTVFLVNDPQLDRKVALKQPRISGPDKAAVYTRFLYEAQAAAKLRHPHICKIHDYGEIDGAPYYTMEFIEGTPLSEKCPQNGLPRIADAVAIVRSVADAMSEAHSKGVIHRDLKPGNIILDKRGEPIVVDFGLAREVFRGNRETLTSAGMIVGTIGYMSPEQISGRSDLVGPASDVWSLGIILHELLTGRQPFVGSQTDVLAQILRDDPRKPSELRPDLPPELEAICLKMLQKQLHDRYATMSEVVAVLDVYLSRRDRRRG